MLPLIKAREEKDRIVGFIKKTLQDQQFSQVVIGISGGIDSATCLYLLAKAISQHNIHIAHLPYIEDSYKKDLALILKKVKIPQKNLHVIPIKPIVERIKTALKVKGSGQEKVRVGNIAARIRMIALYDLAKKYRALVCGTENKSEYCLSYFTRFGDEAADFEPIRHLYKTQVYQLARYLKVPDQIINKPPTAGLWQKQTDEAELGFSYQEADQVLNLYLDQKQSMEKILKLGLPHARQIIKRVEENAYKHHTPWTI